MTALPPLDPVLQARIAAAVRAMMPEIVAQVEAALLARRAARVKAAMENVEVAFIARALEAQRRGRL